MNPNDIQKIKTKCKCLDPLLTDAEIEMKFLPVIDYISIITGWQRKPCETLYLSTRSEYITDIKFQCRCQCDFKFQLRYKGLNISNITIKLIVVGSNGETEYEVPNTSYHFNKRDNSIVIDTRKDVLLNNVAYNINRCCCDCSDYYYEVTYDAGYIELPDCIIDILCYLFNYLNLSQLGECTSGECMNLDRLAFDAKVKSVNIGDISYSFDFDSNQIKNALITLPDFYAKQLKLLNNVIVLDYIGYI